MTYARSAFTWAWMRSWSALVVTDWARVARLRPQGRVSDVARGHARCALAERKALAAEQYEQRADRLAACRLLDARPSVPRGVVPARTWLSAISAREE